jgi:hypothetical protein
MSSSTVAPSCRAATPYRALTASQPCKAGRQAQWRRPAATEGAPEPSLYLGIDYGTSGARAIVIGCDTPLEWPAEAALPEEPLPAMEACTDSLARPDPPLV